MIPLDLSLNCLLLNAITRHSCDLLCLGLLLRVFVLELFIIWICRFFLRCLVERSVSGFVVLQVKLINLVKTFVSNFPDEYVVITHYVCIEVLLWIFHFTFLLTVYFCHKNLYQFIDIMLFLVSCWKVLEKEQKWFKTEETLSKVLLYISQFLAVLLIICSMSFVGKTLWWWMWKEMNVSDCVAVRQTVSLSYLCSLQKHQFVFTADASVLMHGMHSSASHSNYWMYICWLSVVCHWWCWSFFSVISTFVIMHLGHHFIVCYFCDNRVYLLETGCIVVIFSDGW